MTGPMNNQQPPDPGWETEAPNAYKWTSEAFDLLIAGKLEAQVTVRAGVAQAVASGECPRCHDQFTDRQVLDAVVGESIRTLGTEEMASTGYLGLTVSCKCTEPHHGRPAGVTEGCGINFRIEVRAPGSAP